VYSQLGGIGTNRARIIKDINPRTNTLNEAINRSQMHDQCTTYTTETENNESEGTDSNDDASRPGPTKRQHLPEEESDSSDSSDNEESDPSNDEESDSSDDEESDDEKVLPHTSNTSYLCKRYFHTYTDLQRGESRYKHTAECISYASNNQINQPSNTAPTSPTTALKRTSNYCTQANLRGIRGNRSRSQDSQRRTTPRRLDSSTSCQTNLAPEGTNGWCS
jgi:hypothetical protein